MQDVHKRREGDSRRTPITELTSYVARHVKLDMAKANGSKQLNSPLRRGSSVFESRSVAVNASRSPCRQFGVTSRCRCMEQIQGIRHEVPPYLPKTGMVRRDMPAP